MKTMMLAAAAVLSLAAAAVLSLAVGSAVAGEGDDTVANTFFTQLPGVVAQAPSQQVPSAVARNQGGAPTAAFVTNHSSGTWLFPPYQGGNG